MQRRLLGLLGFGVVLVSLAEGCTDDPASPGPAIDAGGASSSSSGSSGSGDGGAGSDGGSSSGDGGGGACAGADPATVQALANILGGWRWSKDIVNGKELDLPACDQRIGYFIGPDVPAPDYAKCAVARGEIVMLRGGNYPTSATGCTDLTCSNIGILMSSSKAAAVYALGADGKTTGPAVFFFTLVDNASLSDVDLLQSNAGSVTNAKRMIRATGVPSCK